MAIFLLVFSGIYIYIAWKIIAYQIFGQHRDQILCRVHVNGIRGKSTVTRYICAVFREAGFHTFGKTTGSAARIIRPDGKDYDFHRRGYPNVNEQVTMLDNFARQKAEVVVLECMAVNPVYARWLEEKVMHSHIGIITNVRYDHPEYLGQTLPEIARSLCNTIPYSGILITSEYNTNLLHIIAEAAKARNTQLIIADTREVTSQDLEKFPHFAHKENVAIGYTIAKLLELPRERALSAMQSAESDPGTFTIKHCNIAHKQIAWANLFAVNDRESFLEICLNLFKQFSDYTKVIILNNRLDRPTRVKVFVELAKDLNFDQVITLGDYEASIEQEFLGNPKQLICLGNASSHKNDSGIQLLQSIAREVNGTKILLIGAVNIHTPQGERLLEAIDGMDINKVLVA